MVNDIVVSLLLPGERLHHARRYQGASVNHLRTPLILDLQTAGGLLVSIPAVRVESCVAELRKLGYERTCVTGLILAQGDALEPIFLVE